MKKIVFVLSFTILLYGCGNSTNSTSKNENVVVDTTTVDTTSVIKESPKATNWSYSEEKDKMTSKTTFYADCESPTRINFEAPYEEEGGSKFTFMLRNSTKNEMMLSVSKGQFIGGIGDKTIRVKFDDEQPIDVPISSPSDGSADFLFLTSSKMFAKLKKSKKMIIEPEFYDSGLKQIEFDIHDLIWKH